MKPPTTFDSLQSLYPRLLAFARKQGPSTADDLVQEALLRAWSNRDRYPQLCEDPAENLSWFFTVIRRIHLDHLRRDRFTELSEDSVDARAESSESVLVAASCEREYRGVCRELLGDLARSDKGTTSQALLDLARRHVGDDPIDQVDCIRAVVERHKKPAGAAPVRWEFDESPAELRAKLAEILEIKRNALDQRLYRWRNHIWSPAWARFVKCAAELRDGRVTQAGMAPAKLRRASS